MKNQQKIAKMIFRVTMVTLSVLISKPTFSQDVGPYYFVSLDVNNGDQIYAGNMESYGGVSLSKGINVLATLLGDDPSSLLQEGQELVPAHSFNVTGGSVTLQPFAYTESGSNIKKNLPIGPNLLSFLNDPLDGSEFNLALPFVADNLGLSDQSAALRGSHFHMAIDFDVNGATHSSFNIVAPADGVIEGYRGGSSITLRHTASNGKEFLTYYQHLDPATICPRWVTGAEIKRGEKIGRADSLNAEGNPAYTHLHFGVAVKGPSGIINDVEIPEMWYEIDPFGVFDRRRNPSDVNNYNYLPYNTLSVNVRDIRNAYVFRANPPIGALEVPDVLYCQEPEIAWMGNCFCDAIRECSMLTPWRVCWWNCISGVTCIVIRLSILALYILGLVAVMGEIRANLLKERSPGPISRLLRFILS